MTVLWQLALVVVGLVVLTKAADAFVDGAVAISDRLGIPPVVVGAVVIGLGTSAPELVVSVLAAIGGDTALGVGNVVGSNIANLTLVLGAAAVMTRITVTGQVIWREATLALGATTLFAVVVRDGFTRLDGFILLGALVVIAVILVATTSKADPSDLGLVGEDAEHLEPLVHPPVRRVGLTTGLGLAGTVLGAQLLVWGATGLAETAGLSAGFVGVTLVAIGTSLPELVTSIQAARRGETGLIVGNVLGSNIFNAAAVGGAMALVRPGPIGDAALTGTGIWAMVAVSLATWVLIATGRAVVRIEGILLVASYGVIVVLLA